MRERRHATAAVAVFVLLVLHHTVYAYYPYNGTGNNANNPTWGAIGTPQFNLLSGEPALVNTATYLPNERNVSTVIGGARPFVHTTAGISDMLPNFGQMIVHDITFTQTNASRPDPIAAPVCDSTYDPDCTDSGEVPFFQSQNDVPNHATAFIDAEVLYGQSAARAAMVRDPTGGGRLLLDSDSVLPLMSDDGTYTGEFVMQMPGRAARFSGDPRLNVNPALIALETIFAREHNLRAAQLANDNPDYTDDELYELSRMYVTALIQRITVHEYLPAVLGTPLSAFAGYDDTVNPGIDQFFSTVAFRYAHSAVNQVFFRLNEDFETWEGGHMFLRDSFFDGAAVDGDSLEPLLRGLMAQTEQQIDSKVVDEMRDFFPTDVLASNIRRGRERGLPSYVDARAYFGLSVPTDFDEITSDSTVEGLLREMYGSVENVDAIVGGLSEDHVTGGTVGELFATSIRDQFMRLRCGDAFWYERSGALPPVLFKIVSETSFADIIRRNTDMPFVPATAFGVTACEPMPPEPPSGFSLELLDGYELDWIVEDGYLLANLYVEGEIGFAGLGFGAVDMVDVDIVLCAGAKVSACEDYWSEDFFPVLDTELGGKNDISNSYGEIIDGVTHFYFEKKLSTNDKYDTKIKNEDIDIIFSVNSNAPFGYHGDTRGSGQVNFVTGESEVNDYGAEFIMRIFHGVVLGGTWSAVYPVGIYIARYMKAHDWWLEWHVRLQGAGVAGAITFVLLAVIANTGKHFVTPHGVIGMTLSLGLLVQALTGRGIMQLLTAANKPPSNRDMWVKAILRYVHRILGTMFVILAPINVYLGMLLLLGEHPLIAGIYFSWVAIVVTIFAVSEFLVWTLDDRQHDVSHLEEKSWQEIATHVNGGSLWLVIDGMIVDVASFVQAHPGGQSIMLAAIGTDVTNEFLGKQTTNAVVKRSGLHKHSQLAYRKLISLARFRLKGYTSTGQARTTTLPLGASHFIRLIVKDKVNVNECKDIPVVQFTLALPDQSHTYDVQPGQYVVFQANIKSDVVERPYTPFHLTKAKGEFECAIKLYPKGVMSRYLKNLSIGQEIKVMGPIGTCLMNAFHPYGVWPKTLLLAAGSGITPMLQIITEYRSRKAKYLESRDSDDSVEVHCEVVLVTFNRNDRDIIMADYLEGLQDEVFSVFHVVSQPPDDWQGFEGHISADLLKSMPIGLDECLEGDAVQSAWKEESSDSDIMDTIAKKGDNNKANSNGKNGHASDIVSVKMERKTTQKRVHTKPTVNIPVGADSGSPQKSDNSDSDSSSSTYSDSYYSTSLDGTHASKGEEPLMVFYCGPPAFQEATESVLNELHVPNAYRFLVTA